MTKMKSLGLLLECAAVSLLAAQDDSLWRRPGTERISATGERWTHCWTINIVLINDDGSAQSKTQFLSTLKVMNAQEQQVAPESMSVDGLGKTAIATRVFRAKGVEAVKRYVRREGFVDTWLFSGGKWVCAASDATPVLTDYRCSPVITPTRFFLIVLNTSLA